jgi:hypothetical protein
MPLRPKLRYTPTKGTLGICLRRTIRRMPSDRTSRSLDTSLAIPTRVLRFEASGTLRPQIGQAGFGQTPQTPRTWCSLSQSPLMTWLPRSPGLTLVLWLNQETVHRLHLAILATMRPTLDPTGHRFPRTKPTCLLHTWRPHRQWPFALVLHLHQNESSRNLHLQYLAKDQSTQCCQSLITPGSDHPPVLEPHMVLSKWQMGDPETWMKFSLWYCTWLEKIEYGLVSMLSKI